MKSGGLFIAVGVLAVLGGLVWWSNKHPATDAKSTIPAAPKLISVNANQIEGIRLAKTGSDPIELAKLANSWEIVKPTPMHADQDSVNMLTGSLATLNADRLIDDHPASLNEYGLTNPTDEIDVSLKGGKTQKLLLGSDTDKTVNDLRDKRLLTFNQDKLTAVTLTGKGPAVEFGKNAQGEWQITKPKPMRADSLQVDDLIRKLKDAKMDPAATVPDAKGDKVGTVSTSDNLGTQTLDVWKAKDNSYYAKSSVVAGTYKLAGDLGDSFSKGVDDFRNKKLFDFGFNDPSKIDINGMAYQKSGDKWTSGSAQYDAGSLQMVIDKLRDLSATKFVDRIAGTQLLAIGVTSGDNHRSEKVTINKDGDAYDAQRENEPAVYVLDAKSVDDLQKAISAIKLYQAPKPEKKK
jgi:hypothetical protein